jgi:hypothetical protein
MPLPWEKKTLEETQEEDERLSVQLSIAQKKAMIAKLRANGLSVKRDFGGSIKAAIQWLKAH